MLFDKLIFIMTLDCVSLLISQPSATIHVILIKYVLRHTHVSVDMVGQEKAVHKVYISIGPYHMK